jgi:predicted DNA-binding helix-hairpin-helix protein
LDDKFVDRLRILSDAAKYDASCASSGAPKRAAYAAFQADMRRVRDLVA